MIKDGQTNQRTRPRPAEWWARADNDTLFGEVNTLLNEVVDLRGHYSHTRVIPVKDRADSLSDAFLHDLITGYGVGDLAHR